MKKLLIVGAGSCQINAIKRMKQLGYYVIAADYNKTTDGKALADEQVLADAFNVDAILACAKDMKLDGLLTVGTDQPVYTVSKVAEILNLPTLIDSEVALRVTNKKEMKQRFQQFKLPTAPFAVVSKNFATTAIMPIKPPYVIKPVDSQGQRGIFKVDTVDEIRMLFDDVLRHSREEEIIVEEFYESTEVTVSGWVSQGRVSILSLTDRVTFPSEEKIGVCIAHRHPSVHKHMYEKIEDLTKRICHHFDINNGPIYFQMLIGDKGIWINEIACRLGGAYEDKTIPYVADVEIMDLVIASSIGENIKIDNIKYNPTEKAFNTQLFFAKPGKISAMTPISVLKNLPFVLDAGYNFRIGDEIGAIKDASQRAGYFIVTGKNELEVESNIEKIYAMFEIQDEQGKNMVITYKDAKR